MLVLPNLKGGTLKINTILTLQETKNCSADTTDTGMVQKMRSITHPLENNISRCSSCNFVSKPKGSKVLDEILAK